MDRATRRRLLWSFLSNWVARLSSTIMQLVGVPVFLHFWSVPLYGNWIVVSAIPSYLSFSSVGFGSVAGNEMTMLVARADRAGALRVFQSCWWLIVEPLRSDADAAERGAVRHCRWPTCCG